jgi:hypothetical protein
MDLKETPSLIKRLLAAGATVPADRLGRDFMRVHCPQCDARLYQTYQPESVLFEFVIDPAGEAAARKHACRWAVPPGAIDLTGPSQDSRPAALPDLFAPTREELDAPSNRAAGPLP